MIWNLRNGVLELNPVFDMRSPYAGIQDWSTSLGCIKIKNDSSFFDGAGFGIVSSPPANFYLGWVTTTLNYYAIYGPQKI